VAPRPDIIAVIPARFASVRLPGKAMADIGGKPMVRHVVERASASRMVSRVIVATDHESIAAAARDGGAEAFMTPPGLPSGTDRVAFVAESLAGNPVLVNVQGDEPFMPPGMIDDGIGLLLDGPADCAATVASRVSGTAVSGDPDIVKVAIDLNGDALYFSRSPIPFDRDRAGAAWLRHIGLYVYRKDFLKSFSSWEPTPLEGAEKLEQLRILEHGRRIRVAVGDYETLSVDTPADLDKARAYYLKLTEKERA
jgi:3-deoxy-manno-octulosonate cytidylyltransferase (CMP-KDO synthetase)